MLQELEEELSAVRSKRSVLEESSMMAFEGVEEKLAIIQQQQNVGLPSVQSKMLYVQCECLLRQFYMSTL